MAFTMTRQRFEELVGDALDLIPPEFAAAMDNVVILVEDRDRENPTLLGLYHGVALTERTSQYGGVLPDRITIYREAILDICHDEQDVVEEVAITVVQDIPKYTPLINPTPTRVTAGHRCRSGARPHVTLSHTPRLEPPRPRRTRAGSALDRS